MVTNAEYVGFDGLEAWEVAITRNGNGLVDLSLSGSELASELRPRTWCTAVEMLLKR